MRSLIIFVVTMSVLGIFGCCNNDCPKDRITDRYPYEIGQIDGHNISITACGCTSSPIQSANLEVKIDCYVDSWNPSQLRWEQSPVYSGVGTYFKRMEKEKINE